MCAVTSKKLVEYGAASVTGLCSISARSMRSLFTHLHSASALHQCGLGRILISRAAMPSLHAFVPCPVYFPRGRFPSSIAVSAAVLRSRSSAPAVPARMTPASHSSFRNGYFSSTRSTRIPPRSNAQHEPYLSCIYFCVHDFPKRVGKFCEMWFSCKNVMIFAERCSIIDHV